MAKLIKTNGEIVEIEPKNGTDFSLEELQAYVGGYIEIISIREGVVMVVDEEGRMKGLSVNRIATNNVMMSGIQLGCAIVGDVVLCKSDQIR